MATNWHWRHFGETGKLGIFAAGRGSVGEGDLAWASGRWRRDGFAGGLQAVRLGANGLGGVMEYWSAGVLGCEEEGPLRKQPRGRS